MTSGEPAGDPDTAGAMRLEIRQVRSEEHQQAGGVTAEAYREFGPLDPRDPSHHEDYLRRLADVGARTERAEVLVAVEGGRILGTVTLELHDRIQGGYPRDPLAPDQAHVRMLAVDPAARGRGVGRRLMEACVERAREAGKRRLTLDTTPQMTSARRLYESMGFRPGPDQVFENGFRLKTYELAI